MAIVEELASKKDLNCRHVGTAMDLAIELDQEVEWYFIQSVQSAVARDS